MNIRGSCPSLRIKKNPTVINCLSCYRSLKGINVQLRIKLKWFLNDYLNIWLTYFTTFCCYQSFITLLDMISLNITHILHMVSILLAKPNYCKPFSPFKCLQTGFPLWKQLNSNFLSMNQPYRMARHTNTHKEHMF